MQHFDFLEVDNGRDSQIKSCTLQFWLLLLYLLHGDIAVAINSHCRSVSVVVQCSSAKGYLPDALPEVPMRERRTWSVKKLLSFPSHRVVQLFLCAKVLALGLTLQTSQWQFKLKYGAVEWEPGDRLYHLMTWWFVLVLLELSSSHQGYSGSNLEGAGGVDMGTWYQFQK